MDHEEDESESFVSDIKFKVAQLVRLHRADLIGKDKGSQELRAHLKVISELALGGPKVYSILARETPLVSEISSLLASHENENVVSDVLQFVCDLTDPENFEVDDRQLGLELVNQLMDSQLTAVIASHVMRKFDMLKANCLTFFDNLCEIYPSAGPEHIVEKTSLLSELLTITNGKHTEKVSPETELSLAASELLSVLLFASESAKELIATDKGSLNQLLEAMAIWKNDDPEFPDEQEWCENVHSCLRICLMDRPEGKKNFVELNGVKYTLRIRPPNGKVLALKLLNVLVANDRECCLQVVDADGLRTIFPALIDRRREKKRLKTSSEVESNSERVQEALGIIASFCINLKPDDVQYLRVRAKLLEDDKLAKVIDLHNEASIMVHKRVTELEEEDDASGVSGEQEDEEYLDMLEHGLDTLQKTDVILARLLSDTDEPTAGELVRELLGTADAIEDVRQVVADFAEKVAVLNRDNLDEEKTTIIKANLVNLALF